MKIYFTRMHIPTGQITIDSFETVCPFLQGALTETKKQIQRWNEMSPALWKYEEMEQPPSPRPTKKDDVMNNKTWVVACSRGFLKTILPQSGPIITLYYREAFIFESFDEANTVATKLRAIHGSGLAIQVEV